MKHGHFASVVIFGALAFGCATREFDLHGVLSRSQWVSVNELAAQCGITNEPELEIGPMLPGPYYSISAKGEETIRGREVSFVTVEIMSKRWLTKAEQRSGEVLKSNGYFWVPRHGGIRTNTLTTFVVPGTIRLNLSKDVPLPTADRIVEAFAAGKVRYANDKVEGELNGVNLSKPLSLDKDSKRQEFLMSYSGSPSGRVFVYFNLDEDRVTVISVERMLF